MNSVLQVAILKILEKADRLMDLGIEALEKKVGNVPEEEEKDQRFPPTGIS